MTRRPNVSGRRKSGHVSPDLNGPVASPTDVSHRARRSDGSRRRWPRSSGKEEWIVELTFRSVEASGPGSTDSPFPALGPWKPGSGGCERSCDHGTHLQIDMCLSTFSSVRDVGLSRYLVLPRGERSSRREWLQTLRARDRAGQVDGCEVDVHRGANEKSRRSTLPTTGQRRSPEGHAVSPGAR